MNQTEIKAFLEGFAQKKSRTIVIVDYGNVDKWVNSTKWKVGVRELGKLIKNFSQGKKFLRRFYYGSDYGPNEKSHTIVFVDSKMSKTRPRASFDQNQVSL